MSHAKQFIFGDAQAWIKGSKPCRLRKAVKKATGTTCFVYERGDLVKTFDVKGLFHEFLKESYVHPWRPNHWDDVGYMCSFVRAKLNIKQDQNNRLLQKIRKLI